MVNIPAPPAGKSGKAVKPGETPAVASGNRAPRRPSFISGTYLRRNGVSKSGERAVSTKPANLPEGAKTHTVQKGEYLGAIAAKYYGSSKPKYVKAIVAANSHLIKKANDVRAGWVLAIPDVN